MIYQALEIKEVLTKAVKKEDLRTHMSHQKEIKQETTSIIYRNKILHMVSQSIKLMKR
jgi:hypothetical protein